MTQRRVKMPGDEMGEPTYDSLNGLGDGDEEISSISNMDPIERLLNADQEMVSEHHTVFNKRLGIKFTFRPLTEAEYEGIKKSSTFNVAKKGELPSREIEDRIFGRKILIVGTVSPNWNDGRLREKFGSADKAVSRTLKPGEITAYSEFILKASGFQEEVGSEGSIAEQIKNF